MKRCGRCKTEKDTTCFPWRNKAKKQLNSWCRECIREYDREKYLNTDRPEKVRTNHKRSKDRAKDFLSQYLEEHPCVDCGEKDPVVLQFDHLDPSQKSGSISVWVSSGYGLKRISEEIAKCEVRCANCHIRRTAVQFGWWKVR